MKLKLEIEVEYDEDIMHGDTEEDFDLFKREVLFNTEPNEGLLLHSNYLGDEVGEVKVIRIISTES